MNTNSKNSGNSKSLVLALLTGLALALLSKLIYDLFNGYAIVPNLLIGLGISPSAIWLEGIQFVGIVALAFFTEITLLKAIPNSPEKVAVATAIPWVAVCGWGIVSGMVSEHEYVILSLYNSSLLSLAPPLLMLVAVPFGVWLAYRGKRPDA